MTAELLERQREQEGHLKEEWHVRDLFPTTFRGFARIFEGIVITLTLLLYCLTFPEEAKASAYWLCNFCALVGSLYLMGTLLCRWIDKRDE